MFSTLTFLQVKIDRNSLLNCQEVEGVDAVGAYRFLVKHLGYN